MVVNFDPPNREEEQETSSRQYVCFFLCVWFLFLSMTVRANVSLCVREFQSLGLMFNGVPTYKRGFALLTRCSETAVSRYAV